MDKPSTYFEYSEDDLLVVRRACLYLANVLGGLKDDIVIIGGLVPSLLMEEGHLSEESEADSLLGGTHPGTRDLDVGLAIAVLEEEKYTELSSRLRNAGFSPHIKDNGNPILHTWRITESHSVTVDFLIAPSREDHEGGKPLHIERDFAPIIIPGLDLAFADRKKVRLKGHTILEEWTERSVWVCGPGAFLVLKALAIDERVVPKDAYDFSFVLNSIMFEEPTLEGIRAFLFDHRENPHVHKALSIIRRNFARLDGAGPMRTARFRGFEDDDQLKADALGLAQRFLEEADEVMSMSAS